MPSLVSILEKIQALPDKQKVIGLSAVIGLMIAAFVGYVFMPKNKLIKGLEEEIGTLNAEINIRQTKARRLEELKKEYEVLKTQLVELEKQLPEEAEVEMLLKQVSDLGERNGLLINLWRPGERKPDPSGIYTAIPMEVAVSGGYHALGAFFEKVGALHRIVNISNIRMGNAKREGNRFAVEVNFLATTFSAASKVTGTLLPAPPAGQIS